MAQTIVQINYSFSIPRVDLEKAFLPAAQPIADTPGLRWKIWLMDEANSIAGGIYLFEDEASALAFVNGPIAGSLKTNPVISNISAKLFGVSEEHTAITRGPVLTASRV
jgi:hypothetical protein